MRAWVTANRIDRLCIFAGCISCVGKFYFFAQDTGKSLSKALLFAEHWENMLCTKIVLNARDNFCTQHVLPRFELGIFMYRTCNSMRSFITYCGLVDAKIGASDKDLPVLIKEVRYLLSAQ